MSDATTNTYISAFITLVVTFTFSYAYKIQKNPSSLAKCLASGIILSALIFHIIPDIYQNSSAPMYCAISFIFLFAVDKMYLCGEELPKNVSIKKAIAFIFALSLHSLFEGLSCHSRSNLTSYLIGLLGHKWAEAFVFGVSIREVFNYRVTFLLICLYSVVTPLGMLLGIVAKNNVFLTDVMNGLSGGSFFYIGFIEMLNSEFMDRKNVKQKTLYVVYGFVMMTGVLKIMDILEENAELHINSNL